MFHIFGYIKWIKLKIPGIYQHIYQYCESSYWVRVCAIFIEIYNAERVAQKLFSMLINTGLLLFSFLISLSHAFRAFQNFSKLSPDEIKTYFEHDIYHNEMLVSIVSRDYTFLIFITF